MDRDSKKRKNKNVKEVEEEIEQHEVQKEKSKKQKKSKSAEVEDHHDTSIDVEKPKKKSKSIEGAQIIDEESKKSKKQKKPKQEEAEEESDEEVKPKKKQNKAKANAMDSTKVEWQKQHNVTVAGSNSHAYAPYTTFDEASKYFSKEILSVTKGFDKPTPIQAQCWPIVLDQRDIIAIAETGSGKTLAFTLPGLVHINRTNSLKKKAPTILVLSPTRELALQTAQVCTDAGSSLGLSSVCIYGGVPKPPQKTALKQGVGIIIATPGRLLDLAEEGCVDFSQVTYLVLDEADRMLDMGFEKDIRAIIGQLTQKERQTLMFSATWPQVIQALAKEFLNDPVQVTIGSLDLAANHRVTQHVEVIDPYDKDRRLMELLQKHHKSRKNRVLVFALYKKEAARIEANLRRNGWQVQAIHGDKAQTSRSSVIEAFKDGSEPLLVATDVAARGLDIPDVEFVINYTFPLTIEDYVHRIGRTGRGGKSGVSYTFFTLHDKSHAGELINVLNEAKQKVPEELTKFGTHVKKKEHALYGNHFKEIDANKKSSHVKFD